MADNNVNVKCSDGLIYVDTTINTSSKMDTQTYNDLDQQLINQQIDRLKLLYPNVNETLTPLPRVWSSQTQDKCSSIGLSLNNLRVHYKGMFLFYQ